MTKKQIFKIIIDISMAILFILLMYAFKTGLEFHEIAGLSILAIVIIHNMLNWSWIKNTTKNLSNKNIKVKTKLMYGLNAFLLVGTLVIVITGILISKFLFPFIAVKNQEALILIHKISSYICLGTIGIHVLIHAKYLIAMFKKIALNIKQKSVLYPVIGFAFSIIFICSIYWNLYTDKPKNIENNFIAATSAVTESSTAITSQQMPEVQNTDEMQMTEETQISESNVTAAGVDKKQSNVTEGTKSNESSVTSTVITETAAAAEEVSLSEYLSGLFCTACPKHCSLADPRCGKGEVQASEATEQYNALYGQA